MIIWSLYSENSVDISTENSSTHYKQNINDFVRYKNKQIMRKINEHKQQTELKSTEQCDLNQSFWCMSVWSQIVEKCHDLDLDISLIKNESIGKKEDTYIIAKQT